MGIFAFQGGEDVKGSTVATTQSFSSAIEPGAMRLWLVSREYDTRQTVTLAYASVDGRRSYTRQASVELLQRKSITAAIDRDEDDTEHVDDDERRERYAAEAERMAADHDPDDEI